MASQIEVEVQQMSGQSEPHSFLASAICWKVRKSQNQGSVITLLWRFLSVLSVTLEITVLESDDSSCLYREPRNKVSHWTRAEPRNARKKFFRSWLNFQSSWTHKLKFSNWSVFVFTQHILSKIFNCLLKKILTCYGPVTSKIVWNLVHWILFCLHYDTISHIYAYMCYRERVIHTFICIAVSLLLYEQL